MIEVLAGIGIYFALRKYVNPNISDLQIVFVESIWSAGCVLFESIGRRYRVTYLPLSEHVNLNNYMRLADEDSNNVDAFFCALDDEEISKPFHLIDLSLLPGLGLMHIALLAEIHAEIEVSQMSFQITQITLAAWSPLSFTSRRFWQGKKKGIHRKPLEDGEKVLLCFDFEYDLQDKRAIENGRFIICLKTRCNNSILWHHSMIEVQSHEDGYEILSQYHTGSLLVFRLMYFLKRLRLNREPECVMLTYLCKP